MLWLNEWRAVGVSRPVCVFTGRFTPAARLSFTLVIEAWALIWSLSSLVVKVQSGLRQSYAFDGFQKAFVSRLLWGQF